MPQRTVLTQMAMTAVGIAVLVLFGIALIAALRGDDNTFKTTMGTGAYGLANLVVGYYFGSSVSSDKKTDLLAANASKP